jgi:hypothetical protein
MKKILLMLGVIVLTYSCKKECNCSVITEMGKLKIVKGNEVMVWSATDTVGIVTNCNKDGDTIYSAPTLRQRTICK